MVNRRQFLHTSAATVAALALSPQLKAAAMESRYLDTMGLQLWTVRNQMQEDQQATLKAVADAGYRQVELMNVLGSEKIAKIARDAGMKVTSAFASWEAFAKPSADGVPDVKTIVDKAAQMELKHLVFGYIAKGHRETVAQYQSHAANANKAGELCKKAGIQLCYHNHSFEFGKLDGEQTGFDILTKEFDPALVKFEIDVFWVKVGGRDPFKTMKQLSGRISQVHLKDLKDGTGVIHDEGKVPVDAFQECGNGTIDMAKAMKLAAECGVEQCHVEQDQSPNPLNSIVSSMKHLKTLN